MKAMFFMTTRLMNDVRACEVLAQTGYPMQSLAMAASAFELAYRAVHVGKSDAEAQKWARHDDVRYSYPRNLKETMRAFYRGLGAPEQDADMMYKNRYQPLAAAKHANPRALANFGIQRLGDTNHIFLGAVHDKQATLACQVALVECVRLVGMVLSSLVTTHVPHEDQLAYHKPLERLLDRTAALGLALQTR